jgi:hypothetical protein
MIKTMIHSNQQHSKNLMEQKRKAVHYAAFETILLTAAAGISLLFVYKTAKKKRQSVIWSFDLFIIKNWNSMDLNNLDGHLQMANLLGYTLNIDEKYCWR